MRIRWLDLMVVLALIVAGISISFSLSTEPAASYVAPPRAPATAPTPGDSSKSSAAFADKHRLDYKVKPLPSVGVPKKLANSMPYSHARYSRPDKRSTSRGRVSRAAWPVKRCINIANALEAPSEGVWGYKVNAPDLARIASGGFDTVRIPIAWNFHARKTHPYTIDAQFFRRIDTVIRQAHSSGLNIIINVHNYAELSKTPSPTHEARLNGMWRQIAERYRHHGSNLIFEIVNEAYVNHPSALNRLNNRVLRTIRQSNPTRTVIVGGANWNSAQGLFGMSLPDDPYIVATAHDYEPFPFTHQGAFWVSTPPPPLGVRWGTPSEYDQTFQQAAKISAWSKRTGIPVLIGEFGAYKEANADDRAKWTKARRQAYDSHNLSWCYFDFATSFPAYNPGQGWITDIYSALMR